MNGTVKALRLATLAMSAVLVALQLKRALELQRAANAAAPPREAGWARRA